MHAMLGSRAYLHQLPIECPNCHLVIWHQGIQCKSPVPIYNIAAENAAKHLHMCNNIVSFVMLVCKFMQQPRFLSNQGFGYHVLLQCSFNRNICAI